jgi:hypothetical protein
MQKVMQKFGVMEVCRTGLISLKRGEKLLSDGIKPSAYEELPSRRTE